MGLAQAFGLKREEVLAADLPSTDKACALQHLDMFGSAREAHIERFGEGADRCFAGFEGRQNVSPRGISQGLEDGIEMCLLNHVVEYCCASFRKSTDRLNYVSVSCEAVV